MIIALLFECGADQASPPSAPVAGDHPARLDVDLDVERGIHTPSAERAEAPPREYRERSPGDDEAVHFDPEAPVLALPRVPSQCTETAPARCRVPRELVEGERHWLQECVCTEAPHCAEMGALPGQWVLELATERSPGEVLRFERAHSLGTIAGPRRSALVIHGAIAGAIHATGCRHATAEYLDVIAASGDGRWHRLFHARDERLFLSVGPPGIQLERERGGECLAVRLMWVDDRLVEGASVACARARRLRAQRPCHVAIDSSFLPDCLHGG